jgi:hypothetical protein
MTAMLGNPALLAIGLAAGAFSAQRAAQEQQRAAQDMMRIEEEEDTPSTTQDY